ncbi:peroxisomal ATPase PEX1 [Procambarus clarkii]|uniref:peroxisomal ATPase PEX1 n=1 Tax=Procambarus clarkii TaxID=6728 RepID=UPI001E673CDD|nr:peroxisome biogenesis factor 1-like [Procambarus clarkii]
MQRVGFSRSVVVKEWPARHCFVSLPHHWASMTLPAPTPTFCLETSQNRTLVLSWAGDIHNPSAGSDSTVLVSREVLKDSGISDGEVGVLSQIQVPPPCTMITVIVGSLTQWQDLALNAEVAQSAILSQVRVIGLRQCVPLWLEGGACVFLTVTSLNPPLKYGTLQPMTQVEVLPPLEKDGSHDYKAINFTPTSVESDSRSEEFDGNQKVVDHECTKNVVDESRNQEDIQKQNSFKENMFTMILNYIYMKRKEQKSVYDLPVRRDIQLGYRVVPVPEELNSSFSVGMLDHPSLIIISRESLLYTCLKDEVSFIGHLRKINSYKENYTISNASREERSNEIKKQDSKSSGVVLASCLCTVIVWENFIAESNENVDFVKKISALLKVNNCVAGNCLRRLMRLSTLNVIELQTSDVTVKTLPVSIDVLPLTPLDASCTLLLTDTVKSQLKNLVDEYTVIINQKTLMEINLNGKRIDVFITTRDGVPLKLDNKSVVLLEVTLLKQHDSLPYIHSSVSDLNRNYHAKFPYVGYEGVFSNLKQHVLLTQGCQTDFCNAGPQFALLHGSKGSGKTSLVESLIECLSTYPYYMHADIVSCKQLKGKKMQTVEKKLQLIFREAIFKRPSIIILDDIDHLVPSQGSQDQDSGPVYEHTMQMVSMITGLLDQLVDFICDTHFPLHTHNPKSGSVIVIATCITRTSVHPLLVNPQGHHFFPCTFGIPPLEAEGRVKALNGMLQAHMKKYMCQKKCLPSDCVKSCSEDTGTDKGSKADEDPLSRCLQIDAKLITRLTESFVLPDLNHLALRTFLQAKQRWGCKLNEKVSKSKSKAKILEQIHIQCFPDGGTSFSESSAQTPSSDSDVILNVDVAAALEGYIPLALRGLALSEKKSTVNLGIGGLAEASSILEETLTWPSTYPNLFSKITLRLRSGVLLYGPPGCGKTLLANTVTANCSLNLISVKGPELLSKYIGASEEAVRNAFERASSAKPCVLFFDEFESIAPRRGHDSTGVTDRVVNQLLTQMDGVEGLTGVYILAATSRPDLIDPALLRPGRLDKCVFCPIPSLSDREEILQVLSEAVELGEDVDWSQVARSTENFTGADLQSVLSTAQVLVAQEALGDNLYKGVIQSDQSNNKEETTYSTDPCEQAELKKGNKSLKLAEEYSIGHKKEMDTGLQHDVLEEVIIEKEIEKVTFSQKRFSVQKDYNLVVGNENEDTNIQIALVAEKLECDKPLEYNASDCDLPRNLELKVFKRHIDAALKEVKPSVTQAERLKYEHLYATFTKSKDGSFGHPSPGKRATLA